MTFSAYQTRQQNPLLCFPSGVITAWNSVCPGKRHGISKNPFCYFAFRHLKSSCSRLAGRSCERVRGAIAVCSMSFNGRHRTWSPLKLPLHSCTWKLCTFCIFKKQLKGKFKHSNSHPPERNNASLIACSFCPESGKSIRTAHILPFRSSFEGIATFLSSYVIVTQHLKS